MNLNRLLNDPDFAASAPAATLRDAPLGFLDVGARGGVHEIVEPIAGVTAVLGFEPDLEELARLRAELAQGAPWARAEMDPTALADKAGVADLYLLSKPTNHSLRPPNKGFTSRYGMSKWQQMGVSPLQTRPLDEILFGSRLQETFWGELIKLDTQGTEYEILDGARRTLRERTVAVIAEVEFFQVYEGQRLFSDVECLMREHGFSFYGFNALHYRSCRQLDSRVEVGRERVFHTDALFFKDPLPGGPIVGTLTRRQQHVLFVCALLTEYYDFALELARETWAKDDEEADRIRRLVRSLAAWSPRRSADEVAALADRVRARPEQANVELGTLVGRFRHFPDFDDLSLGWPKE